MTIADDGIGGARSVPGMQDRVAAQGGTIAIVSPPGEGTRIAVELPCGS
jgi:signal transduction histidine kinase